MFLDKVDFFGIQVPNKQVLNELIALIGFCGEERNTNKTSWVLIGSLVLVIIAGIVIN